MSEGNRKDSWLLLVAVSCLVLTTGMAIGWKIRGVVDEHYVRRTTGASDIDAPLRVGDFVSHRLAPQQRMMISREASNGDWECQYVDKDSPYTNHPDHLRHTVCPEAVLQRWVEPPPPLPPPADASPQSAIVPPPPPIVHHYRLGSDYDKLEADLQSTRLDQLRSQYIYHDEQVEVLVAPYRDPVDCDRQSEYIGHTPRFQSTFHRVLDVPRQVQVFRNGGVLRPSSFGVRYGAVWRTCD